MSASAMAANSNGDDGRVISTITPRERERGRKDERDEGVIILRIEGA